MTTRETAYFEIKKLVKRFKDTPASQRKTMNENATQGLRSSFFDPSK